MHVMFKWSRCSSKVICWVSQTTLSPVSIDRYIRGTLKIKKQRGWFVVRRPQKTVRIWLKGWRRIRVYKRRLYLRFKRKNRILSIRRGKVLIRVRRRWKVIRRRRYRGKRAKRRRRRNRRRKRRRRIRRKRRRQRRRTRRRRRCVMRVKWRRSWRPVYRRGKTLIFRGYKRRQVRLR